MNTVWSGRLVGEFYGYKPGRTYKLSDGTKWFREDRTDEPVYREEPDAKLLADPDTGLTYLDVQGTSAIVRVFKAGTKLTPKEGAF